MPKSQGTPHLHPPRVLVLEDDPLAGLAISEELRLGLRSRYVLGEQRAWPATLDLVSACLRY